MIVTAAAAAVVVMAVVEKEKLQEESVIRRFYQIILSWDYFALLKESKAIHFIPLLFFISLFICFYIQ